MVAPEGYPLAFRIPFAAASNRALREHCKATLWQAMVGRARCVVELVGQPPPEFVVDDRGDGGDGVPAGRLAVRLASGCSGGTTADARQLGKVDRMKSVLSRCRGTSTPRRECQNRSRDSGLRVEAEFFQRSDCNAWVAAPARSRSDF
jgi:hypothetical protein